MGRIIRNGIEYGSGNENATNINYDGTVSGLEATTVQEAVDKVSESLNPNIVYSYDGIIMKKYGKLLIIDFNNARIDHQGTMPIPEEYTIMDAAVTTLRNITDKSVATLIVSKNRMCTLGDLNSNGLTGKTFYGQIVIMLN